MWFPFLKKCKSGMISLLYYEFVILEWERGESPLFYYEFVILERDRGESPLFYYDFLFSNAKEVWFLY